MRQVIDYWLFTDKRNNQTTSSLRYTIVLNGNKVVRVFNHVKLFDGPAQKKYYIIFNSIQETSEVFLYFKEKYEKTL